MPRPVSTEHVLERLPKQPLSPSRVLAAFRKISPLSVVFFILGLLMVLFLVLPLATMVLSVSPKLQVILVDETDASPLRRPVGHVGFVMQDPA